MHLLFFLLMISNFVFVNIFVSYLYNMYNWGACLESSAGHWSSLNPSIKISQTNKLGFSLFQLKLSIIYTDNFCLVSLSYVERDNKKRKQNMFPFDFFVIDHFVANFDQKMLEKRDIKKNIFSMALGRTYAWISILFSATDTFRIN